MFSVKPLHLATSRQIEAFRRCEHVAYPFLTRYSYVTWSKYLIRVAHTGSVGVCKSAIKLVSLGHFVMKFEVILLHICYGLLEFKQRGY
jgi:hypothetical protein